jgi:hypothetical protein
VGYTNYWERDCELPIEAFSSAASDCKKVFKSLEVNLSGASGQLLPELNEYYIAFNGSEGLSCEDFVFSVNQEARRGRERANGYCKTEKLPYDICVKIALIILKHHLGDSVVASSDGDDSDWREACQACQKILGYGQNFKTDTIS